MSLELIVGPMYSGKTTEIIRIASRYNSIGKNMLVINHKFDTRYGTENVKSHSNIELMASVIAEDLQTIKSKYTEAYKNADIIIIEELQFFINAYDFVIDAVNNDHKIMVCAGLDGDFEKKPFGDVLRLIPEAEKVTKLTAFCKICGDGTKAYFTKRIVESNDKILVGSNESYIPTCRKHHNA